MPTQLLIYERAVPVSSQRHRDYAIRTGDDFSFAARVNSFPLVSAEVSIASATYPVVFAGDDEVVPVAMLGVRDNENLFVKEGRWDAPYIPAFVRRYPFVFSTTDDGGTFALCIDEGFPGVSAEGRGERLFDANGERTQYLNNVLNFLQLYQAQFQRTQALCRRLGDLDLFEPMQAQVRHRDGPQLTLSGFKVINRDRLKELSAETLGTMAKADELELIYAHLASLRNFTAMAERLGDPAPLPAEAT